MAVITCGERGVGQVARLQVARGGVREPRAFEVCQARWWRRSSRRSQGGRGRGQEDGPTVRVEETCRDKDMKGESRAKREHFDARQPAWKVYTEKKLVQTLLDEA